MERQARLPEGLEGYEPSNHSSPVRRVVKGHVPTPEAVVDLMVGKLFERRAPKPTDLVLDPGCGDGPFIEGIIRYCRERNLKLPKIVGVELDPIHLKLARRKFRSEPRVELVEADYLAHRFGPAEFIIGNPPYVPITDLDAAEKDRYRRAFASASGRFDLYLLFFEQSVANLKANGRLCFITPEKFEYVATAAPLRKILGACTIRELYHADEATFPGLVTYPTITTLVKRSPAHETKTRIVKRDGQESDVTIPRDGSSWNGSIHGQKASPAGTVFLEDIAVRVSCGVATGADDIYVLPGDEMPSGLRRFAHPTISGRQLALMNGTISCRESMLLPYDKHGVLLPESRLGDLRTYLARPSHKRLLEARTCVTEGGKQWYAFHDNAPLEEMLRPKLLCKDIAPAPKFWADREGSIVPRHSLYYVVPREGVDFDALFAYLNGEQARDWLRAHCHRAANNFLRLQSSVLKKLPVPEALLPRKQERPP